MTCGIRGHDTITSKLEQTSSFSKQLNEVTKGWWPACRCTAVAAALPLQEAQRLTLGQPTTVLVPCAVVAILNNKGHCWISWSWLAKYRAILVDQEDVILDVESTLNPATLLPTAEQEPLQHDSLATIEQVYASKSDLKDEPLKNVHLELYTNGSSFVTNR